MSFQLSGNLKLNAKNPAFLIRSTASANRSFDVQTVILTYPSPGAPKPLPGVVTIPAFSSK